MAKLERIHFAIIIVTIILIVAAISIFRPAPTGYAGFQASSILRLNITVTEGVCILNVNMTNPTSAAYAYAGSTVNIPQDVDTDLLTFNITNAGNTKHNLTINASYWAGPNGTHSISTCNQTHWANFSPPTWARGSFSCYGGTSAGTKQVGWIGMQVANISNITYFQVRIPLLTAGGVHNQNITLTSANCL